MDRTARKMEVPVSQGIRDDLKVLKGDAAATLKDVAVLAQDLRNEGGNIARDGANQIKSAAQNEYQKLEDRVRERPGQSAAIAFCAGMVLSYVLSSRR